ncbi:MAG: hypothetical protein AAFO62_03730 [Pseudomonadota bacterium]
MRSSKKSKSTSEKIRLPGRFHPFLIVLALVGLVLGSTTSILFVTNELPIFMFPLLGIVALSAFATTVVCIGFMLGKTLEFTTHELIVHAMTGNEKYRWVDIEALKVVGASGSFGDNPFTVMEKRISLALFNKGGREGRAEAHEADVILASGDIDSIGERFVKATQQASSAIRKRETAARNAGSKPASRPVRRRIGEGRQPQAA